MTRYKLTLARINIMGHETPNYPHTFFEGHLTLSDEVNNGASLITSIKSRQGVELLLPVSSGNDNLIILETLQPTGGSNSGFLMNLPESTKRILENTFGDTGDYVNIWDNYNGISMETVNHQYFVQYSLVDESYMLNMLFLFTLFLIVVLAIIFTVFDPFKYVERLVQKVGTKP